MKELTPRDAAMRSFGWEFEGFDGVRKVYAMEADTYLRRREDQDMFIPRFYEDGKWWIQAESKERK